MRSTKLNGKLVKFQHCPRNGKQDVAAFSDSRKSDTSQKKMQYSMQRRAPSVDETSAWLWYSSASPSLLKLKLLFALPAKQIQWDIKMKTTLKHTAKLAGLALCINGAAAQDVGNPLEELIVVANRVPVSAKRLGTSVSVMNEADIIAHSNVSLTDIIRQLPSVGASRNGPIGSATSLRIRGEEGFRTLTRFDGIKLSDPSGPQVQPQLQHIVSSGIERVEVLRGPQGLSFGADAGGVIDITSRQGTGPLSGSIDGHGGSFGTNQLALNVGAGTERADFYVSASTFQTDGFNARVSDTNPGDNDGYDNESFHGRVGINLSEQWRLDLVHRYSDGDTEFDGCTFTANDCNSLYELEASRVQLKYTGAAMNHSLAATQTKSDNDSLTQGVSAFTAKGKLERLEYIGQLTELNGFDLVFGVDVEQEANNAISRDNIGYYGEFLSDFSDTLFFTAGVRLDDNDDFGQHTSLRVSTAYLIDLGSSNTLKLKASAGTGFRAPSTSEIAYNAGPFAAPPASNVVLSEETSQGFEFGIEYFLGAQLKLEAVYFNQDVEDAIFFDLELFSGYLQDVGNSTSSGIELIADYALNANWTLKGNYTFNDTERPNGLQRIRRPEHLANLGVSYRSNDSKLAFNAFYRSSANAIDGNTVLVPLDDFDVLDINARYQISDSVEIYARIENALDENYQEIAGFNSAERGSYIGANLSF